MPSNALSTASITHPILPRLLIGPDELHACAHHPSCALCLEITGSMPGDVGFDPLGLSSAGIPLGWMREAELKHGRVCMLAIVGWIAADIGLRAPGLPADSPLMSVTSFTAHDAAVKQGSMIVLLIFCGVCEIAGFAAIQQTLEGKRAPGDFALTGNIQVTDSIKKAEIKHSRLAMMAFSGIATQSAITHGAIGFPYF